MQGLFALLAGLMLDFGLFLRTFAGMSILFWIVAIRVLTIRPGQWGLRFLRFGMLAAFGLVFVLLSFGEVRGPLYRLFSIEPGIRAMRS